MMNFDDFSCLSFDCYGTLIDWEAGISSTLGAVLESHGVLTDRDSMLELYTKAESEVEAGQFRPYNSQEILGVEFYHVFTAQQIGSYKPSPLNFEYLIQHAGVPEKEILHVAQSLFHDIAPARAIGLSTVWINRRKDLAGSGATPPAEAEPDLEVPDLRSLAVLTGVME